MASKFLTLEEPLDIGSSTITHSDNETLWPPPADPPYAKPCSAGSFTTHTTPTPTPVHAPSPATHPPHTVPSSVFVYATEARTAKSSTLLAYSIIQIPDSLHTLFIITYFRVGRCTHNFNYACYSVNMTILFCTNCVHKKSSALALCCPPLSLLCCLMYMYLLAGACH